MFLSINFLFPTHTHTHTNAEFTIISCSLQKASFIGAAIKQVKYKLQVTLIQS